LQNLYFRPKNEVSVPKKPIILVAFGLEFAGPTPSLGRPGPSSRNVPTPRWREFCRDTASVDFHIASLFHHRGEARVNTPAVRLTVGTC